MFNSVYKISKPVIKHVIKHDKMYIWLSGYYAGAIVYAVSQNISARRHFGRMRKGQMMNANLGKHEFVVIKRTTK